MRILIAPDKFKGTLSAPAAALAIAEGVRAVLPDARVSLCPLADGGDGTLATLLDAVGGRKTFVSAADPWGKPVRLPVAVLEDGTVCIESATTARGDPMRADSHGLGLALVRAIELEPAARLLVGIGGTISTDGGSGLARAFGWRFLDGAGDQLPPGGGALVQLDHIAPPDPLVLPEMLGLCDVLAPLTGPSGSARRFASQKGAAPEQIAVLEKGLERLAQAINDDLGIDVGAVSGAGAGGGIGAGIVAFCGGELRSGFDYVAEALGLRSRIAEADLVVTGEGRFDEQSIQGKAAAGVARLSHEEGVPCIGLFGGMEIRTADALTVGFSDIATLPEPVRAAGGGADDPAARLAAGAEMLIAQQPV